MSTLSETVKKQISKYVLTENDEKTNSHLGIRISYLYESEHEADNMICNIMWSFIINKTNISILAFENTANAFI